MEYLKGIDFQLLYHSGKANPVADVLIQKRNKDGHKQVARLWTMTGELVAINPLLQPIGFLLNFVISIDLIEPGKMIQVDDKELNTLMENSTDIKVDDLGIVRFQGRLCVPNNDELRQSILQDAHHSKFSVHLGATKICKDLKGTY